MDSEAYRHLGIFRYAWLKFKHATLISLGVRRFSATVEYSADIGLDDVALALYFSRPLALHRMQKYGYQGRVQIVGDSAQEAATAGGEGVARAPDAAAADVAAGAGTGAGAGAGAGMLPAPAAAGGTRPATAAGAGIARSDTGGTYGISPQQAGSADGATGGTVGIAVRPASTTSRGGERAGGGGAVAADGSPAAPAPGRGHAHAFMEPEGGSGGSGGAAAASGGEAEAGAAAAAGGRGAGKPDPMRVALMRISGGAVGQFLGPGDTEAVVQEALASLPAQPLQRGGGRVLGRDSMMDLSDVAEVSASWGGALRSVQSGQACGAPVRVASVDASVPPPPCNMCLGPSTTAVLLSSLRALCRLPGGRERVRQRRTRACHWGTSSLAGRRAVFKPASSISAPAHRRW